jgi:hypothetical protein
VIGEYKKLLGEWAILLRNGPDAAEHRKLVTNPPFTTEAIAKHHKKNFDKTIQKKVLPLCANSAETGDAVKLPSMRVDTSLEQVCRTSLGFHVTDEEINGAKTNSFCMR